MKLTEPEWIIMNALWDKHPAKARNVVARWPSSVGWAYTTVKTMLDRLLEKRAVKKSKSGRQKEVEVEGRQAICI
jgi:BlaI family penicillinase repressor